MSSNGEHRLATTEILPKVSEPRDLQAATPEIAALNTPPAHPLPSRSNYDYIKRGLASHLGLHYPVDLTATVNSTRNYHKRAEKNRRDCLSLAMQELTMLLPQRLSTSNSFGNQRYCKAETVENAVQYIKELQEEINALKRLQ